MHTFSLADQMRLVEAGDMPGLGAMMLESAGKLAGAGADFLICPDNTVHQAMPYVLPHSPRPWLHIAAVAADEAVRRGYRRLGLTGTRWLVQSEVYPAKLAARGIECIRPQAADRVECSRIIMEELVYGQFRPASVAYFRQVIDRLKEAGADAVILGCTEIPLIIDDSNSALPTLDSTRLLARAALRRAVGETQAAPA